MNITVVGATGFIGKALIAKLLQNDEYVVTAFSKSAAKLQFEQATNRTYRAVAGNVFDVAKLTEALQSCDVAYYLVHMMGARHDDYAKLEAEAATIFTKAAAAARVKRIVFLGGLGDSTSNLSKHLASRQRTGTLLRQGPTPVIELRASMIIGSGSVAYEIIKAIAHKLPVTAVPTWANTKTQPIGLRDMLAYLVACATLPQQQTSTVVEVGGPEVLTYPQILVRYTAWCGKRQRVFLIPFVPRWAAKLWLNQFVSNKASGIGGPMVESLHYPMIVTNTVATDLFPTIQPAPIEQAFS